MRKIALILFLVFALQGSAAAYNGDVLVYVTNTGECYHRDGCSYLKSRIEMTLERAVDKGYRGCSRCSPPELGVDSEYDTYSYDEYRHRYDVPDVEAPPAVIQEDSKPEISVTGNTDSEKKMSTGAKVALVFFLFVFVIYPLGDFLFMVVSEAWKNTRIKKKQLPPSNVQKPPETLCDAAAKPAICAGTVEQYRNLLEGKSVWELAGVPDWAYFDGHDFPHTLQGKAEGPGPFIVYVTGSGACYHKPGCRMAKGGRAVNICEAKQHGKCACSVCKPMEKLPDFVERYQRIKNIQRTFRIRMLP